MKKSLLTLFVFAFLILLMGCDAAEKKMDAELAKQGDLFLSHHFGSPSLGPCGFSRSVDDYEIKSPGISGRIESSDLKISKISDTTKYNYSGYIEFINANKVYVALYRERNGVKTKLSIDGYHKI